MGIYCTTTSLSAVMLGTTFDTATTALATKCIGWAESEINKYLSKRYDLDSSPFNTSTSIPPIVTTWAEWLSEGYMRRQMGRGSAEARERFKDLTEPAIENLKMVAEYKLDVVDTTGNVVAESASGAFRIQSSTMDYSNTFNEDDELNWRVSENKLDDIDTDRGD